jgi:hypothetical protein
MDGWAKKYDEKSPTRAIATVRPYHHHHWRQYYPPPPPLVASGSYSLTVAVGVVWKLRKNVPIMRCSKI